MLQVPAFQTEQSNSFTAGVAIYPGPISRRKGTGSRILLFRRRAKRPAAPAHALTEPFALLRGHFFPARHHPSPPEHSAAAPAAAAQAAQQKLAQEQKSERLPET